MSYLVTNFFPFYYFSFLINFVVSTPSCPLWVQWIFYISFYYHRHRACRIILCTLCDKHAISIFKSITTHFFSGAKLKHISGHTRHFVPKSFSPEALSPFDPIPKRHFTRPSCDWTTLNFSLIFFFYSTAPSLITSSFDL